MSFSVIVDTREQRPLRFKDVPTIRRGLKTGDYSIEDETGSYEDRISIERKSLEDLLSSITHRREHFDAEIERGEWINKVHPNAVMGTIFKWQMRGIPVIYAQNQEKAAHYVAWFFRLFWERRNGTKRTIL